MYWPNLLPAAKGLKILVTHHRQDSKMKVTVAPVMKIIKANVSYLWFLFRILSVMLWSARNEWLSTVSSLND